MKKKIKYCQTLFFYDVPMLFHCIDGIGCDYLCLLVEEADGNFIYLCTPVSRQRLNGFNKGYIELREIYTQPETSEFFTFQAKELALNKEIELDIYKEEAIPDRWLPDSGFFLTEKIEDSDEVLNMSREIHKPVLFASLDVPESKFDTRIDTDRLSHFLSTFQNLVKHAYRKACKSVTTNIVGLEPFNAHKLQVVGFDHGSFTIKFETLDAGDLFGSCGVELSFEKIDAIAEAIDDPDKTLEILKKNKGHMAGAYIRLLIFLIENDANLNYKWAVPISTKPVIRNLTKEKAKPLVDFLMQKEDIGSEPIELIGKVIRADKNTGSWKILNDSDNKEYQGIIKDNTKLSLEGIVIGTTRYKFQCEEIIEEVLGTGKEKKVIYLLNYFIL